MPRVPTRPTPEQIAARPPPPPAPPLPHERMADYKARTGYCSICGRSHVTDEDRERGIRAGNVTCYNINKAEEAYHHYMHDLAVKQTPPEYSI